MARTRKTTNVTADAEEQRLREDAQREKNWKRWGPYLAERQWGTVREDYSADGDAWKYFPFEHAASRAYRWGEDGLLGITDRECRLCFALALWNERDPLLKERLFGLANRQGNHGEDVKEAYFYLDSSPTYAYLKALYKYPQDKFPYARLIAENAARGRHEPEFELDDTGVFDRDRYFDVLAEYAKAASDDILIRITVANRGDAAATIHVLPTLWFRNTWIWGCRHEGCTLKPRIEQVAATRLRASHETLGCFCLETVPASDGTTPTFLFTENETNTKALFDTDTYTPYVKDAFHRYVIHGEHDAVHPKHIGTKAAPHYVLHIPPHGEVTLRLRLFAEDQAPEAPFNAAFDQTFRDRVAETDAFYASRIGARLSKTQHAVARQAYAGLLWSKQFYHYVVEDWLSGDPASPPPPTSRKEGRNHDWPHLFNRDVVSMPDSWEYPWYAAWDLAFHMIPMAKIDPTFAKQQLLMFLREWYMHPNGQIPAYEYNLSDVNPPVHAWACWRVYKMTGPPGARDRRFLESAFQKLLLNFTWWVNRKDRDGRHLFAGGFLGLDNIGVFDRSQPLPKSGYLNQADGTAWMAFYCTTMLAIALELALEDPVYEDMASKFFEHFVAIADALNTLGGTGLWHEGDGFYYDKLHLDGHDIALQVRSLVGLIPLLAVEVVHGDVMKRLPGFRKRTDWFLKHRADLARHVAFLASDSEGLCHGNLLLAVASRERLKRVLAYLFDEQEFLSPFGIRSLSRDHLDHPYAFAIDGASHSVAYTPGEAESSMFGGNSNWRGPVWFPVNYLLIEALERYHYFHGDTFAIEFPTRSGRWITLQQAANEIAGRLTSLFLPDAQGRRPCHGDEERFACDPHWRDLVLFHEYFHGDDGRGLGASHQTGWTALVTRCLEQITTCL